MEIERIEMLSIPVWRTRVPEFEPHAEALEGWVRHEWERGSFRKHAYGYGYQSPSSLYTAEVLATSPELQVLRNAFEARVREILKQRVNQSVKLIPEPYAFTAWVLVQTAEEWVSGPWHDHYPSLLSGCYYLRMPETKAEGEGALAFMRPGTPDAFGHWMDYIKPRQGDFILFPSNLMHRPTPSPSADGVRISINMDAYVHWRHWNEQGKPVPQNEAWTRDLLATLPDRDA